MSDSEDDTQISVKIPQEHQISDEKQKKPRKKVEVSERMRAACQANAAKAREGRAKKKADKLAAEDETQMILRELVDEKKKAKAGLHHQKEKPISKKQYERSPSEEDESEESESDSSEDSDVELVLRPAKKKTAKEKTRSLAIPKRSAIMEKMAAMQAKLDAMEKKEKSQAPVNVYFNQKSSGEKKVSALDSKFQWE